MKQTPLISVIVPVYNVEQYLRKCLESIVHQTYPRLEIILVNDGSTDQSGTICDEFKRNYENIYVIHQKNQGLSGARNSGLKICTGDYIGFVDSDDWIDPEMYAELLDALLEAQAEIAICGFREVKDGKFCQDPIVPLKTINNLEALENNIRKIDHFKICNAVWNKLYKRETIINLTFPEGKYYEDILFTMQALFKSNQCTLIGKTYYNYRINRIGSIMNIGFNERILTDEIPFLIERIKFFKENDLYRLATIASNNLINKIYKYYDLIKRSKPANRIESKSKLIEMSKSIKPSLKYNIGKMIKFNLFLIVPNVYIWLRKVKMV